jgi:hypothetical protein
MVHSAQILSIAEPLNTANFQRSVVHGNKAEYVDDNIGGRGVQLAGADVDLEDGDSFSDGGH